MDRIKKEKQMIVLVAPPRSISTAFLRMMEARKDFKIFNEPSSYLYNKKHYPQSQATYGEQLHATYQDVIATLCSELHSNNVFVKEMSFAFEEFIANAQILLENKNVSFVFLLRNPHHCIISYYKKMPPAYLDFMMPDLAKLTGFEALYNSFQFVREHAVNQPYIIHAEQLSLDPETTVENFCKHLNLPYSKKSLAWENLGDGFTGYEEWQETKKKDSIYHWHQDAIQSSGFHQPSNYELDENNLPAFSEIDNGDHRKKCVAVFQQSKVFYDLIANTNQLS